MNLSFAEEPEIKIPTLGSNKTFLSWIWDLPNQNLFIIVTCTLQDMENIEIDSPENLQFFILSVSRDAIFLNYKIVD